MLYYVIFLNHFVQILNHLYYLLLGLNQDLYQITFRLALDRSVSDQFQSNARRVAGLNTSSTRYFTHSSFSLPLACPLLSLCILVLQFR